MQQKGRNMNISRRIAIAGIGAAMVFGASASLATAQTVESIYLLDEHSIERALV